MHLSPSCRKERVYIQVVSNVSFDLFENQVVTVGEEESCRLVVAQNIEAKQPDPRSQLQDVS